MALCSRRFFLSRRFYQIASVSLIAYCTVWVFFTNKFFEGSQDIPIDICTTEARLAVLESLPKTNISIAKPYVDFLMKALYQDLPSSWNGKAFTETEKPMGEDQWFWIDDNAKVLEVFSLPGVMNEHRSKADDMIKFIDHLSPGPFFFRRVSKLVLVVESDQPDSFDFRTGLFRFWGSLLTGKMYMGSKFHDGRDRPSLCFGTVMIRYTYNGMFYDEDAENFPVEANFTREFGDGIRLRRVFRMNNFTLTHDIVVAGDNIHPTQQIKVKVEPGVMLKDIQIAAGFRNLSTTIGDVSYNNAHVSTANGSHVEITSDKDGYSFREENGRITFTQKPPDFILHEGPMKWYSVYQAKNIGFAYSIVTVPHDPEKVTRVMTRHATDKALDNVMVWYSLGDVDSEVGFSEQIVLLAGGLYNDFAKYDIVLENMEKWKEVDLSISYDYGAEMHAISTIWLSDLVYEGQFRYEFIFNATWVKNKIENYNYNFLANPNYIFSRGLSYMTVACENFYRITGDIYFLKKHKLFADTILDLGFKTGSKENRMIYFPFKKGSDTFIDTHLPCIWALSRAAILTGNCTYANDARDGFHAITTDRTSKALGGTVKVREDNIRWVYKAGLILRATASIKILSKIRENFLTKSEMDHIESIEKLSLIYLHSCERKHDGGLIEILTSKTSGETNSETQPWALLPLASPDNLAYRHPPPVNFNVFESE